MNSLILDQKNNWNLTQTHLKNSSIPWDRIILALILKNTLEALIPFVAIHLYESASGDFQHFWLSKTKIKNWLNVQQNMSVKTGSQFSFLI